jgi:transcriptional regulator with XRE-family HTH domain
MNRGEQIENFCKENNISVSEVLRKANVSAVTIDNWKKSEPKSFQIYDNIMKSAKELIESKSTAEAL